MCLIIYQAIFFNKLAIFLCFFKLSFIKTLFVMVEYSLNKNINIKHVSQRDKDRHY